MQRRSFLKMGAAGFTGLMLTEGLLRWTPRAHAATISKTYYITDGFITQPDGVDVYFKGYSESATTLNTPAKPLIVNEGDTALVTVVNTLGTDHSFVIDGVVDSGIIGPGQSKTVEFAATAPGTFLFHDKLNAPYNRVLGLHGGLAVMPNGSGNELYTGSPTFVQQYFWVFNDIDPAWNDALRIGTTPGSDFVPRYFTLNGLSGRPPGAPDHDNPAVNAMKNYDTAIHGHVGDRTLIRLLNGGMCVHSVHWHANHVEWLTRNGEIRPDIWKKDTLMLPNDKGGLDVIFPFEPPPDAYPPVTHGHFPMHLHDEMTQTAGGGLYQFGAMTDIVFE